MPLGLLLRGQPAALSLGQIAGLLGGAGHQFDTALAAAALAAAIGSKEKADMGEGLHEELAGGDADPAAIGFDVHGVVEGWHT